MPARPGQQAGRGRGVVVGRAVAGPGQDAAVEHAARQHRDAAPAAQREQHLGGRLIEQRVPAGHQHAVQVAPLDQPGQRAAASSCRRRRRRPRPGRGVRPARGTPRPPPASMKSSGSWMSTMSTRSSPSRPRLSSRLRAHPVPAVVADPGQRRYVVEPLLALDVPGGGHQPPADLGAHGELVPGAPGQELADPPLGHAHTVVRRGVEGPDPRVPGRGQRRGRRLVADRRVEPADGRSAKH